MLAAVATVGLAAVPPPADIRSEEASALVERGATVLQPGMRDEAMMALLGAALIGLGTAVRRAA